MHQPCNRASNRLKTNDGNLSNGYGNRGSGSELFSAVSLGFVLWEFSVERVSLGV